MLEYSNRRHKKTNSISKFGKKIIIEYNLPAEKLK